MKTRIVFLLLFVFSATEALAGTNGILEGFVKDKQNGEPLPGVNVVVAELQQGTSSDPTGRYEIQNIRAGRYEVRFALIGYQTYVVRNVIINPDLRTRLNVNLQATEVQLDEIIVVQEKPLIQKDVTGTTYIISAEEFSALPVDRVAEVIRLKPGVTLEGNVRGGKSTEVVYLVDGLPIQDVISGGSSTLLPSSSIVGLSIYTGGFEPEYGNALSGVVNIVTKTGSNEHRFLVRADWDNLFAVITGDQGVRLTSENPQSSRTSEVEVSGSGPIVENTLYYVGAFNGLVTDTRWWQDFQFFFNSPVQKEISAFAKLDYLFTPAFRLGGQVLYSHRNWHDYEFSWRFNLNGLPEQRRTSSRVAAILSHTVSDRFFYTASVSRFVLDSRIGSGAREAIPVNDPYQYDFFLRYVIAGQRAWWTRTKQETYTTKFDGTLKAGTAHLFKAGGELNFYNLNTDVAKYEPRKTYFGKPLVNEPQLDFSTTYAYRPTSGAFYVQDRIDLTTEGILVNLGVRYDFMNPTASRPAIEAIPIQDTAYTFEVTNTIPATWKHQFSPRVGAAMQLTEHGYLFINLGWYFQFPLFDYLYTGLDRVALEQGVSALTGNPDLEPERTKSYEVSVKYSFDYNIVGSATYFRKETNNLVDTKTFIPGDSKLAGSFGFAEFVNTPYADATGVELVVSRERGELLTGELSYTYMVAEGVSASAEDGFYIAQYGLPPAVRVFPLSWDQRHTVKLSTTVLPLPELNVNIVTQWNSGRPYTNYPTATGFEPVDGGRFKQNNARMSDYFNIDLKVVKTFTFTWWPQARLALYADIRNVTNEKNVRWVDSNGRIGGELGDPSGYYIGRRTNLGVQLEF